VLSRKGGDFPGADSFPSLEAALASCNGEETVYIIGGEMLYNSAIPIADSLFITEVEDTPDEADAFFPAINKEQWEESERYTHTTDEKHQYNYSFVTYIRK
jgi:dihydrofolate reductase